MKERPRGMPDEGSKRIATTPTSDRVEQDASTVHDLLDVDRDAPLDVVRAVSRAPALHVYDGEGRKLFSGTQEQFQVFLRNCDDGTAEHIASINDATGSTLVRFGPGDDHGFTHRRRRPSLLAALASGSSVGETSEAQHKRVLDAVRAAVARVYFAQKSGLSNDLFLVGKGIDPETGARFELVDGDIGAHFDAHGIAKTGQLDALLSLLEHGVDPARLFFTAPFELPEHVRAGAGAGLGTSGGTAYKDGIAVVTGGYDAPIMSHGIRHVFVNDVYREMLEPLAQAFPNVRVHLLSDQKRVLEAEANTADPKPS